jgi:hypothetical protein
MLVCKQWRMIATHDYVWMHRPEAYVKKDEGKFIARLLRTSLHSGSVPGPSAAGATLCNETGNARANGSAGSEGGGGGGQGQSIEYMECTVKNHKNVRRVVQKVTALAKRANAVER